MSEAGRHRGAPQIGAAPLVDEAPPIGDAPGMRKVEAPRIGAAPVVDEAPWTAQPPRSSGTLRGLRKVAATLAAGRANPVRIEPGGARTAAMTAVPGRPRAGPAVRRRPGTSGRWSALDTGAQGEGPTPREAAGIVVSLVGVSAPDGVVLPGTSRRIGGAGG